MSGVVGLSRGRRLSGGYPCVGNLLSGDRVVFGACGSEGVYCVGADFPHGLVLFSVCEKHVLPVMGFFENEGGQGIAVQGIEAATEAWGEAINRFEIRTPRAAG